jgi:hypothetical protein
MFGVVRVDLEKDVEGYNALKDPIKKQANLEEVLLSVSLTSPIPQEPRPCRQGGETRQPHTGQPGQPWQHAESWSPGRQTSVA